MKVTNIEFNNTTYNNISDLFSALVSMTMDNAFVIDGIRATYSDDNPAQNTIEYPEGFHFKNELEQNLVQEQVLSAVAQHAKENDRKKLHDAIKIFLTRTNKKK